MELLALDHTDHSLLRHQRMPSRRKRILPGSYEYDALALGENVAPTGNEG